MLYWMNERVGLDSYKKLYMNYYVCFSEGEWDFYWCDVGWMKEYFDNYYLQEHMRICHFRNHYEVLLLYILTLSPLARL